MFENVNFKNNDEKVDAIRKFLSSKQEELDKACKDYYSMYGEFDNDLCSVNTCFSVIARKVYDFISESNDKKNSKELEKIYGYIKHSYNKIMKMGKNNSEFMEYDDIITTSRQFYTSTYGTILELINPLTKLIFESFIPTQITKVKNQRHSVAFL